MALTFPYLPSYFLSVKLFFSPRPQHDHRQKRRIIKKKKKIMGRMVERNSNGEAFMTCQHFAELSLKILLCPPKFATQGIAH